MITELFFRSCLHSRSFRRSHLSVFKYRLTKNGFSGTKSLRGFRQTGPWLEWGAGRELIFVPLPHCFKECSLITRMRSNPRYKLGRISFFLFYFFFVMVVANCNASCYWLHEHCSQWQLLLFFHRDSKLYLSEGRGTVLGGGRNGQKRKGGGRKKAKKNRETGEPA